MSVHDTISTVLAECLGDAMDCTRDWSAWSYGTMTSADFEIIADNEDLISDIATLVMTKLISSIAPLEWTDVGLGRKISGRYSVKNRGEYFGLYLDFVAIDDNYVHPDEKSAITAANTHYVDGIIGAFA